MSELGDFGTPIDRNVGVRPLPDLNGPEGAAGSEGLSVFSECESVTGAGMAPPPGEPAAENAVLLSIVAVVIALAAFGSAVRTRRRLGGAR